MRLCVIGDPVGHSLSPLLHRQMLARAEADAAEETKTILAEAEQRCQALKQNARTRLDQAAKRIVEGVVKG